MRNPAAARTGGGTAGGSYKTRARFPETRDAPERAV
jgi:hypothetical protein